MSSETKSNARNEREIEFLSNYLPDYNSVKETYIRRELSGTTKERMSIAHLQSYKRGRIKTSKKGRKFNREIKSSVIVTDLENNILKFDSVELCAKYFNCSKFTLYTNHYRNTLYKHKYRIQLIKI